MTDQRDNSRLESNFLEISREGTVPPEQWSVAILNSLHDGIVVVDTSSTIIYANPAYTRSLGVPVKRVLGRKLSEIEPRSRILEVLRTGKPIIDDPSRIYSLGIDIVANISPIFEGDKLIGAVALFKDVSEVIALQEKLKQAETEAARSKDLSTRYFLELQELRSRLTDVTQYVFQSPKMRNIVELAVRLGQVDSTVLITGESGVGKEVIAKLIHRGGKRRDGPFVVINCAAIPENLLESELFGYEKGAFTGANREGKIGVLEMANRGTLLLDEIGDMPLSLQVKLLRVIQEQKYYRIGGVKPIEVDVRFMATTNQDLKSMVMENRFRKDLFYRLNVVPINVPPLRERKEDIAPLARHFLEQVNKKYGLKKKLMPETLRAFERYHWPGNVRELENLIERLAVSSPNEIISLKDTGLSPELGGCLEGDAVGVNGIMPLQQARAKLEKEIITRALAEFSSARKAAVALGIDPATLIRKMRRLGIRTPGISNFGKQRP